MRNGGSGSSDEEIWIELFPSEPYRDKTLRTLKSRLLVLVQEFLIIEELRDNQAEEAVNLLDALRKRELTPLVNTGLKSAKRKIDRELDRSSSYFYNLYQYESSAYYLNKTEIKRLNRKIRDELNLDEIIQNLDLFYAGEKLKYHCAILGWEKLISPKDAAYDISDLLKNVDQNPKFHLPHIQIYKCIYETLTTPDEEKPFLKLKELISSSIDLFPLSEAKEILDAANNYCLRKINKGEIHYLDELHSLYQMGLNSGVLLFNDQISPWTFKNIVGVSLRLKRFDWTKTFIDTYADHLESDLKESVKALSLAQLNYYMQNYEEVINQLRNVEFKEFALKVNAEVTLIATLYELDEFDVLSDVLHNFSKFLNRIKNVNPEQKGLYKNLIKYVARLIKPMGTQELRDLKKSIKNTQGLASKSWLLEKVDELLGVNA
ncbi:MAG: hypothetical protein R3275_07540 [Saprospiraceae bacterium]|nr:hypothetical protein [Saprospiraceae bacterium]